MLWQWSPGVFAELAASATLLVLAIYFPWRDLTRRARLIGVTLIFDCALWILSHAFEIGLPSVSYKEALVGIQLVLGIIGVSLWLFYIFHYLGPRKSLSWRIYILFGIIPLIAILALSTNNIYGLMWTGAGLDSQNPYLPLQPTYGAIYWACMVYVAALTLTGSFLIIWNVFRHRYGYSPESISLLIAAVIPVIVALIEVTGLLSPLKVSVGITPWVACIGAVILILNLPQFRAEQVIPVARNIIFERIGDCILVLDKQNRVLDLNPAAEQLTGCGISDAFGLPIEQIWPYQSSPILPFNTVAGKSEELVLKRDGKQRTYALRISTIVDPGGRLTGKVVLLSDITERKRVEEALQESEEKYRSVVENAKEAIFISVDGMIKFANRRASELSGYSIEEFGSRHFIEFVHPDDNHLMVERYPQGMEHIDVPKTTTLRVVFKQGDIRWVKLSEVLITWEGRPAILSFLTDITNIRRLEVEQQRVQKLESVGLLAGGIAHDFNNILTAILGNISLAGAEAAPGSELRNGLEQAEKASLRAKDLTQQLLTFSKGGAPITRLSSLTQLVKDTAGFALRGSNVKCRFSILADLWHAEIDSGQVSQVIHNLVINAQQAMPSGGSIELRAENFVLSEKQRIGSGLPLLEGNYVRVIVADHGSGISAEHLEKIFDPFFTTKKTGSGLGLATSFSIARNHGGHLSVESEPGSGSTFYLYLPASTQTAAPKPARKVASKAVVGRARILVMDDEQGVREIAGRMLTHLGYADIEFATDGAAAIKLYKAAMKSGKPFTVAVLDLTIAGGMGGIETVQKLLKIDADVRAIVSSGYAGDSAMAEYRGYGFSGMVAKPYTLEQLRKALQDVME
jgi:PAS domain S-box-containing protein